MEPYPKIVTTPPYNKLPQCDIINVSNEDVGDMNIAAKLGVDHENNKRIKEEAFSIAKLTANFEQKMKEKMTTMAEENAMKMAAI